MKYILYFSIALAGILTSCTPPQDERATALCECYGELHRVNPETDTELLNVLADSCKTLHIEILNELEESPEDKAVFDAAYEYCQNEK